MDMIRFVIGIILFVFISFGSRVLKTIELNGKVPFLIGVLHQKYLRECFKLPCLESMNEPEKKFRYPAIQQPNIQAVWDRLPQVLKNSGHEIVRTWDDRFLHATFAEYHFGQIFIDDLEFLMVRSENTIHVRSEPRATFWFFDNHRVRMDQIISELMKQN